MPTFTAAQTHNRKLTGPNKYREAFLLADLSILTLRAAPFSQLLVAEQ
jgi:hypothetical protein